MWAARGATHPPRRTPSIAQLREKKYPAGAPAGRGGTGLNQASASVKQRHLALLVAAAALLGGQHIDFRQLANAHDRTADWILVCRASARRATAASDFAPVLLGISTSPDLVVARKGARSTRR